MIYRMIGVFHLIDIKIILWKIVIEYYTKLLFVCLALRTMQFIVDLWPQLPFLTAHPPYIQSLHFISSCFGLPLQPRPALS